MDSKEKQILFHMWENTHTEKIAYNYFVENKKLIRYEIESVSGSIKKNEINGYYNMIIDYVVKTTGCKIKNIKN